jgi:CCR4-NOT transcription complex subunit 9
MANAVPKGAEGHPGGPPGSHGAPSGTGGPESELSKHILDLLHPERREGALLHLSKHRETYPDLAPMIWWSFGTMSALLQEIVAIYPSLSPPTLTAPASNRVCNALALLQCVASHSETRKHFLSGEIAAPPFVERRPLDRLACRSPHCSVSVPLPEHRLVGEAV